MAVLASARSALIGLRLEVLRVRIVSDVGHAQGFQFFENVVVKAVDDSLHAHGLSVAHAWDVLERVGYELDRDAQNVGVVDNDRFVAQLRSGRTAMNDDVVRNVSSPLLP